MSKPVNTLAIGGFVVGALVILVALMLTLSGGGFGRQHDHGLVVFDGSVKGLKVGAPVAFKGVDIGEVTKIHLYIDTDNFQVMTPVEIRVDRQRITQVGAEPGENFVERFIERGLRAQLQTQSLLTGLLYVELDLHPGSELRYADVVIDVDEQVTVIPTIPTDMEKLSQNLEKVDIEGLLQTTQAVIEGINRLVNDPELRVLAGNVNQTLNAITRASDEIGTLSQGMNQLMDNADTTVTLVNQALPSLSTELLASLTQMQTLLTDFDQTLADMNYLVSDDSPVLYDVRESLQKLGDAGQSLQSLAEILETQPEALIRGRSSP